MGTDLTEVAEDEGMAAPHTEELALGALCTLMEKDLRPGHSVSSHTAEQGHLFTIYS